MSLDIILFVLAAIPSIVMAVLGGQLASRKRSYRIAFRSLGLAAVVMVIVIRVRTEHAQTGLQNQLNKIQTNTEPAALTQVFKDVLVDLQRGRQQDGNIAATVRWTTNVPGTSQVEYGTTTNYGLKTAFDPALVTNHAQALTALTAGTTYHYRMHSKYAGGEGASGDYTFTTCGTPDATRPTQKLR